MVALSSRDTVPHALRCHCHRPRAESHGSVSGAGRPPRQLQAPPLRACGLDWGPVLGASRGHRGPCVSRSEGEAVLTRGMGQGGQGAVGTSCQPSSSGSPGARRGVCTGFARAPSAGGSVTHRSHAPTEHLSAGGGLGLGRAVHVCSPLWVAGPSAPPMIDSSSKPTQTKRLPGLQLERQACLRKKTCAKVGLRICSGSSGASGSGPGMGWPTVTWP